MLTAREAAEIIKTKPNLVDYWREQGLLRGIRINDKNEYMYERPDADTVKIITQRTRLQRKQPLT